MTKKKTHKTRESLIPFERIDKRIFFLRGNKVMLSMDLAELYEVESRVLIQQSSAIAIGFLKSLCSREGVRGLEITNCDFTGLDDLVECSFVLLSWPATIGGANSPVHAPTAVTGSLHTEEILESRPQVRS